LEGVQQEEKFPERRCLMVKGEAIEVPAIEHGFDRVSGERD
jgi:hypothetical protein